MALIGIVNRIVAGAVLASAAVPAVMAMAPPPAAAGGARGDVPGRGGPPSPERMFEAMDANRDGVVSKAEFEAFRARHPHGPHDGPGGGPDGRRGPDGGRREGGRPMGPPPGE